MDKNKATELLKQALNKTTHLGDLKYDNQEFRLWRNEVCDILEVAFGKNSTEYERFARAAGVVTRASSDIDQQKIYIENLNAYETALKSIIQKYELLRIETDSEKPITADKPKAFIAHGGQSEALDKLKKFLAALGVESLVVEEQASKNRSVGTNVDWYARKADCAIILATKGDIDGVTGSFIPRGNVLIEIGKAQELFKDRIVYLLQAGTKFPSNISEKVWGRFTSSCMDEAFTKVARELTAFGILRTVKPPSKEHSS